MQTKFTIYQMGIKKSGGDGLQRFRFILRLGIENDIDRITFHF